MRKQCVPPSRPPRTPGYEDRGYLCSKHKIEVDDKLAGHGLSDHRCDLAYNNCYVGH